MTAALRGSPGTSGTPGAPPNRALRLELTLQRPLLWGTGVVALAVLLLAIGQLARLGIVPILLAVAVPVAAGPRDPMRESVLRGTLGISRAAHVRARVRFVLLAQLALLLVAALVVLLGPHGDVVEPATLGRIEVAGYSLPAPTLFYWQDLAVWVPAVLWSQLWVGRDALSSSSTFMWGRALVSYFGMYLLVTFGIFGVQMLVLALGTVLGRQGAAEPASSVAFVPVAVVAIAGGLLALRRRSGVWARTA